MSTQPPQVDKQSEIPTPTLLQSIFSWRAFMALHMNLAIVLFLVFKLNISIALVCMLKTPVNGNASVVGENMTSQDMTPVTLPFNMSGTTQEEIRDREGSRNGSHGTDADGTDSSIGMSKGEFEWDSSTQGLILTSANILGFVMPLLADFLIRKMGAKLLLTLTMVVSAILTLLHPLGARLSVYVLVAMRLALGFVAGVAFPIITEVFSWWAPDKEKVNMMSFAFAGVNIGNVLTGITSGYLCSIDIDNGWPFIFYTHGTMALAWCVLWQFTGTARPEDHPFISEDEKLYILRTRIGMATNTNQKRTSPPYRSILTSVPVWGYLGIMACHYFSSITLFSYLPLFFTRVFDISVEDVGLITSVGYVMRFTGVILWGQLSNLLLRKTRLGKTACRKLIQCGGFYMSTAGVIVLGFITDKIPSIIIVFTVMFLQCSTMASGTIIPLDIAPRFAGFLSGLFTASASLVTFPGPIIIGLVIAEGTLEAWRNVFIIMAVVFFSGATCFLFLGSSTLQIWALPPESREGEAKQDPLHASDLMARRMTVFSMGPPVSPTQKTRFDFTVQAPPPNCEIALPDYNIKSPNTHLQTNGSLQVNSNLNKAEELNTNTESNNQDKNRPSTTNHDARPDKLSYTNPGFEPDSKNVQHKTTEQGSNKLHAVESGSGNASSDLKGEGERRKSNGGLKHNPGLRLNVSQSVPVSFSIGEVMVNNTAAGNFEEVDHRTSGDRTIVEQTRL